MHRYFVGVVALSAAAIGVVANTQEAGPAQRAGWTGITEPDEVIEARRVLMIELERSMRLVDAFTLGEESDVEAVRSSAATMEAMLLAFPHLFPPTTDLYDPAVLEPPTAALPEIWRDFDAFLAIAESSETAAATLAEATDTEALRAAGRDLRASCDACHARFARPYTPPEVTQEDLDVDFDALFESFE